MPAETATQEWVKLPSGLYVSDDRMQKDGETFSLYSAANMDITAFNKEAKKYDVRIEASDPPIDRLVKYSIFLSRKHSDGSSIPTNREYTDMALDTAAGRAKGDEQLTSFYGTLTRGPWDATRDILKFQEKLKKGKYRVTLHRFNEDGELEPIDDIVIAGGGWTRALGARHGYAIETSNNECVVENIENPALEGIDVKGYHHIGLEPEKDEQRIALRGPDWDDERLLDADLRERRSYSGEGVAALRLRNPVPQDYVAELEKARAEAKQLKEELGPIKATITDAQRKLGKLGGKE